MPYKDMLEKDMAEKERLEKSIRGFIGFIDQWKEDRPHNDKAMRAVSSAAPVPTFENPAFTIPPPLSEATVAIVTSAALHQGGVNWTLNDTHFEQLPDDAHNLSLGNLSQSFDRAGFAHDLNVVYPIDRLHELAERGVIGKVASHHYSFAGSQDDILSTLRLDTGPKVARQLIAEGVQVVLLTPI